MRFADAHGFRERDLDLAPTAGGIGIAAEVPRGHRGEDTIASLSPDPI